MKLHTQILAGLLAGAVIGAGAKLPGADSVQTVVFALEPFGTAFIRLITMVVVPLVVASLFTGIASLGDVRRLGSIGGRTLLWFLFTTLCAATIGLVLALLLHVGAGLDAAARASLGMANASLEMPLAVAPTLGQTLLAMIPQNPFAAAAQADLLPLIVAVCIFGAAATLTRGQAAQTVLAFFQGINELCMVVIGWLMRLAPVAVALLVAATVARSGAGLLGSLLLYGLCVILALALHVSLVLLPLLRVGARVGVRRFFRDTSDALLLAFSTASSSATLPVSMAAARNRLGISNTIVSFVLPAGTTLNKNGAAVYKAVTAVFIAQLYGVGLTGATRLTIVLTATMAAFAGAGVPGSSLVTTLIVLNAIGLGPQAAAAIALVAGIDRPLDMCRTTVNTIGNLAGSAWVARGEGETLPTSPVATAAAASSA